MTGRPASSAQQTAPPYVIHIASGASRAEAYVDLAPRVAADVVARYRGMCGHDVDVVDPQPPTSAVADLVGLATGHGSLPMLNRDDAAYRHSVQWAAAQLWDAGLIRERRVSRPRCANCGGPLVPSVTIPVALVRFPVRSDGALRFVGASVLVATTQPHALSGVEVSASANTPLVLARAKNDDYPVVLESGAVTIALGAEAIVEREVGHDEVDNAALSRPDGTLTTVRVIADAAQTFDGATAAVAAQDIDVTGFAPTAVSDGDGLEPDLEATALDGGGGHDALSDGGGGHDGGGGDARSATPMAGALADLAARGLLVGSVFPTAVRCNGCGTASGTTAEWMLVTSAEADLVRTERGRLRAPEVTQPWALGIGDAVVAGPGRSGTPLPLWRCDACGVAHAILSSDDDTHHPDSGAQLVGNGAQALDEWSTVDLHSTFTCGDCGRGSYRWVGARLDPLFDRAALPFARFGFPRVPGSQELLAQHSHADLLVDTDGAWLDARTTLATLLWHDRDADVAALTGSAPMTDDAVGQLCATHGVDAVRWAVATGGRGAAASIPERAEHARGHVIEPLGDALASLVDTARDTGWTMAELPDAPHVQLRPAHDRAVMAALAEAVDAVREALDIAAVATAATRIEQLVADIDQWWSGRWPSVHTREVPSDDVDVASALGTLHECVITTAALIAPLAPFIADKVYERIVRAAEPLAPDSVHLLRYPTANPDARGRAHDVTWGNDHHGAREDDHHGVGGPDRRGARENDHHTTTSTTGVDR